MSKRDPNDAAADLGREKFRLETDARVRLALREKIGDMEDLWSLAEHARLNDRDPGCLLGDSWICRGTSCVWIGQTGIGKSSIAAQAAISWAMGMDFFGIRPVGKLRSVIVQGENRRWELGRQINGICRGLRIRDGMMRDARSMVTFVTEKRRRGDDFIRMLDALIRLEKPNLVWIDPLMQFWRRDVSDAMACAEFLRDKLDVMADKYGVAFQIIHHTGKPPRDPKHRYDDVDLAYMGIGSSDIANWARAIMVITGKRGKPGEFILHAAKRGREAGLREKLENGLLGDRTNRIHLAHSVKGICWIQTAEEGPDADEVVDRLDDAMLCLYLTDQWSTKTQIVERIRRGLSLPKSEAGNLYDEIAIRYNLHDMDANEPPRKLGAPPNMYSVRKSRGGLLLRKCDPKDITPPPLS